MYLEAAYNQHLKFLVQYNVMDEILQLLECSHHRSPTFVEDLNNMSGFDLILDTIGGSTNDMAIPLLRPFVGAKYLDLAWDLISDTDAHGVPIGVFKTG